MTAINNNCSTCKFVYFNTLTRELVCRRFPPSVFMNCYRYPMVEYDDYCGEYKRSENYKYKGKDI